MNAITRASDEAILIDTLMLISPQASYRNADCYSQLRCRLIDSGWTPERFNRAIRELQHRGKLYVSNSRKSLSLIGFTQTKAGVCVYCNKRSRQLTKDHVIPKSRGGSNDQSNIVTACASCNHIKGDRTPAEWARDILNYRKPVKPLTRLPMRHRLQLAITAGIAIVASVVIGGAK